jgi:ATP-dependent DNA helicase RecG
VAFIGTILGLDQRVSQSGKHILGAQVVPEDGSPAHVRLIWFNQPFRLQSLHPGQRLLATGIAKSTVLNWEMIQPQVTLLDPIEEPNDRRPKPVYALTEGLKQSALRQLVREVVPSLITQVDEVLPDSVREQLAIVGIHQALHDVHFPASIELAQQAQTRFKAQELLVLQLAIALQRGQREYAARAPEFHPTGKIHARILNRLKFTLTEDQLEAIADIGQDMAKETPMNRLLQGDVGSGKTVVAQYAMLLCAAYGYQAALMAPTEVLARQHAQTLQSSLSASRLRVELMTGGLRRRERAELLEKVTTGQVDLLVGTQALLSEDVKFNKLGLVIVDEQHKFGVAQRAKLKTDQSQPHYLVLSATPIPRTIAMTAFGDLDVSTIRSKPPGRAPVNTYVSTHDQLTAWWKFVDGQIACGRQAYVIAPRVAETDKADIASAEGIYEHLSQSFFSHRRIGLLHGRLDSEEKDLVLQEFSTGLFDLLVATTVVEVGIDVPNATVMTILDANKLGLAQLHQLRGRVSRGVHSGYVCAVTTAGCESTDNQRLQAFAQSDDGFELAEIDLKLRGPGDLLGTSQSGLPPLRVANLIDDAHLVALARQVAQQILRQDPNLDSPAYERLQRQTMNRYGHALGLSDVG